ncbi:PAS domain S-box protein [Natronococcus sp. A-GB7]|uniref:PAS domain S-box protein n=1 Tax=Natronococcus sp. A-GB7 TaxID=3037649 RepID=UPI00241E3DD6|nr:PAS domain S-box protein [Natronococcus sp. A-GB7]MDG5817496.1 PAS domain S-box protein [Natronococcus sp. A-GB7]
MESPSPNGPDVRTQTRRQKVVADLGRRALETDDLEVLLDVAADALIEGLAIEHAAVLECRPADEALLRAGAGWRAGLVGSATVSASAETLVGEVLRREEPFLVEDVRDEERVDSPELFADHGVVGGIGIRIGPVEEPWGALGAYATDDRSFTRHDASFVESVAAVLETALENRQTRREFEDSYGRISDGFFAVDANWNFTYLNDRAHELINPDDRELVGRNVWESFSAALERQFKPKYERAMYDQETVSFEEYYPEPLDSWFEVRAYPSETGLSVYFRDVTERKERERELELFRTLLDHSNDVVLVIEPESGRILDANETACRRLGYDRNELLELSVPDIERRFADIDDWRAHVEDVALEDAVTIEGVHERKDGTTYPAEVNVSYVGIDEGYMLAVARDVTDRRRRERRLRKSEQQYRTLAENVPNGIVTLFDDDLRYTLAAGRTFDTLPVSAAEIEGQPVRETWPEDVAGTLENVFQAALEGESGEVELEYADREWVVHVVPITDGDGDVFGGMTIAQDITERNERERELEMRERRLSTLIENVPGMVYRCKTERGWPMTFVSDACEDLTGYEPDALERGELSWGEDVMVQEDRDKLWETVHEQASKAEPFSETYRIETADGDLRWVRDYGRALFDEEGAVIDVEGIIADVTDRKRLEDELKERKRQLEESNERLEQFAYAASHDLQEPLRMVTSYLGLIENRYGDEFDADGEEFLAYAVDGAERMREMIDALLEYSRVETQGDPFEPIELEGVVDDVLADLRLRIEETDAEIERGTLPRVSGDGSQVRQVVQNLLENAITYSGDEPPRVRIDADRRGSRWAISVRDEGIGIDPDEQGRVFTVFNRLHSAEEYDGTGIGLALCERIVERHDGEIRVDSEPGEGSTFTFTLPAASERPEPGP